jgi:1-acyl-sn-glycerol-3-phosphate acyltransferase
MNAPNVRAQQYRRLADGLGLGLIYGYARLWHRWSSRGTSLRSINGPAIFIANHTCSADPAFVSAGCPRPISFLVAKEYYKIPLLHRLFDFLGCVPVARNGRDVAAARLALQRLQEGRLVCLFPEGGLSHAGRPGIRRAKCGAAWLALRSRAPVFPILIRGGPQTNSLRRAWLSPSRVHVIFGQTVDLSSYWHRPIDHGLLAEVTRHLMKSIAHLAEFRNGEGKEALLGQRKKCCNRKRGLWTRPATGLDCWSLRD